MVNCGLINDQLQYYAGILGNGLIIIPVIVDINQGYFTIDYTARKLLKSITLRILEQKYKFGHLLHNSYTILEIIMLQRLSVSFLLLAIFGNTMVLSSAKAVSSSTLSVTISGLKNQRGQVCLSLFASQRGFPGNSKQAVQARCVKAEDTPVAVQFSNLKTGNYAVAVFHDANNDGKLNRNFLGIPTEGFGFSQNPRVLTSAPQFEDAAVLVAGSETNIDIKLQYFFGR